jgi:hypothetical protein
MTVHVSKSVTAHEVSNNIRQTLGMKDLYAQRKETIERIFGTKLETVSSLYA